MAIDLVSEDSLGIGLGIASVDEGLVEESGPEERYRVVRYLFVHHVPGCVLALTDSLVKMRISNLMAVGQINLGCIAGNKNVLGIFYLKKFVGLIQPGLG